MLQCQIYIEKKDNVVDHARLYQFLESLLTICACDDFTPEGMGCVLFFDLFMPRPAPSAYPAHWCTRRLVSDALLSVVSCMLSLSARIAGFRALQVLASRAIRLSVSLDGLMKRIVPHLLQLLATSVNWCGALVHCRRRVFARGVDRIVAFPSPCLVSCVYLV